MIKDENGGRLGAFGRCRRDVYLDMADVPDAGAKATSALYDSPALYHQQQSHLQQQRPSLPPPSQQAPPPQQPQRPQLQRQLTPSQHPAQQQQRTPQPQTRTVKRPRPVKSCIECRKRKLKCDRNFPCSACDKSRRICKYAVDQDAANLSDASDEEGSERPLKRSCGPPSNHELSLRGAESTPVPPAQQLTMPVPMVPAQALDEMNRRIEMLEKMLTTMARSPSTAGSSSIRHRLAPANPSLLREMSIKAPKDSIPGRPKGLRTRFLGATSTRVLLNLFPDAKEFMTSQNKTEEVKQLFVRLRELHKVFSDDHRVQMVPIQVYVDSMTPILRRMTDILPKKTDCDRLLETYILTTETIYRIIHIPTFRQDYRAYWNNERRPESFLPLLLVMMALATKLESRSRGPNGERLGPINIPTACTLVRMRLDALKGKDLVDMATLQTEVLLSHTQCMVLKPQESWSRLGFIVRMAMSMGMHRDPSECGGQIPSFEGELRRRLWWTILDMDLHMSLQCNLPCAIRSDDFTCRPPLNLNDEDIYPEMDSLPDEKPHDQFTSCQILVHAAKTLPHRLKVINLINRIDAADENEILEAGAVLERMLEDVQFNFPRPPVVNDADSATRWRTRVVLDMHCRRPLLALYRPFALGPPALEGPPPQISRPYLRSSITMLNFLEELDPLSPVFCAIQHQYYLLLRQDILQAAFSVCYYIRNEVLQQHQVHHPIAGFADASSPLARHTSMHGVQPNGLPSHGQWGGAWNAVTPESSVVFEDGLGLGASARSRGAQDGGYLEPESLCSLQRMEETVLRTLDTLVTRMREMGSDLKDIVSMSVVLHTSVMVAGSSEQKLERTTEGMRKIIESCIQVQNSIDHQPASFLPPTAVAVPRPPHGHPPPGPSFGVSSTYGFNPHFQMMPRGVDAAWEHEFWGWTLPNTQGEGAVPPGPPVTQQHHPPPHVANLPMPGAP